MSRRKAQEVIRTDKRTKAAFDLFYADEKVRQKNPNMNQADAMHALFERCLPEYLERVDQLGAESIKGNDTTLGLSDNANGRDE